MAQQPYANTAAPIRKIRLLANTPQPLGTNNDGSPLAGRTMWRGSYIGLAVDGVTEANVRLVNDLESEFTVGKDLVAGPDHIRVYGDQITLIGVSDQDCDFDVEECK